MKFGLTEQEIQELCALFSLHPEITEVIIFGSRATNSYKKNSDIDLALKGDINFDLAAKVKHQLEEATSLPYFFDVVNYTTLTNQELKQRIDREGKIFYKKA